MNNIKHLQCPIYKQLRQAGKSHQEASTACSELFKSENK